MKVFFSWHAAVEPEYRKLFTELGQAGIQILALLPKAWTEGGRIQRPRSDTSNGYDIVIEPIFFRDKIKRFFYPDFKGIAKSIVGFRPDIIHIFEEPYSLSAAQLVWLTQLLHLRAKIIVHSFENLPPRNWLFFHAIEGFVLKHTDALLIVPQEGGPIWRMQGFQGCIHQIGVGVDENVFKKTADFPREDPFQKRADVGFRIAYIGRLVKEKGVDLLLQAFQGLVRDEKKIELYIVGEGREQEALKHIAERLGIGRQTVFIPSLPAQDLPAFYSSIDILVLPSRTTRRWKEQFGRVLIEAMACEVSVVGSSSGEIPHIIEDAGVIFPEGDVAALTTSLRELVLNSDLRKKYGQIGRQRVLERYTWRVVARQLHDVYHEVLG